MHRAVGTSEKQARKKKAQSERDTHILFSPLTDLVVVGELRDDKAEILFQSFLQEALVSSSGRGRDVYS